MKNENLFVFIERYKNTVSKIFLQKKKMSINKKKKMINKKKKKKMINKKKRIKQQIKNRRILFDNVLLCYKYIIYNKKIK